LTGRRSYCWCGSAPFPFHLGTKRTRRCSHVNDNAHYHTLTLGHPRPGPCARMSMMDEWGYTRTCTKTRSTHSMHSDMRVSSAACATGCERRMEKENACVSLSAYRRAAQLLTHLLHTPLGWARSSWMRSWRSCRGSFRSLRSRWVREFRGMRRA